MWCKYAVLWRGTTRPVPQGDAQAVGKLPGTSPFDIQLPDEEAETRSFDPFVNELHWEI
jgi:hypothetical protein